MTTPLPGPPPLRAAVIIDYQNVHLTGAQLFHPEDQLHAQLVHPLHYANEMIAVRNAAQTEGHRRASLRAVHVFRGLPNASHDPEPARFNQAQRSEWERDARVKVVLRPLKYRYEYDNQGERLRDDAGDFIIVSKHEKGIDVLCALAVVREAANPDIDLVILASQDTDLEPAISEARSLGTAKIETASWWNQSRPHESPRIPVTPSVWNTRLSGLSFDRSRDLKPYS